jgi:hypothetical protein
VRMSEDKVRTKDSCWSVGTIYDPRELPGVSTAGPGIGRGVTHAMKTPTIYHNYCIYHKNRICIHAPMHVHVVQWLGGGFMISLLTIYAIYVDYFRYLRKKRTTIYDLRPTRKVGCWTESFPDTRGKVDLVHGRGTHLTS